MTLAVKMAFNSNLNNINKQMNLWWNQNIIVFLFPNLSIAFRVEN